MIIRVQLQREGEKERLWDHLCRFDETVYLPVEGGVVEEETGRHLLGYRVVPIYSKRKF